jgi:hypothetical protein
MTTPNDLRDLVDVDLTETADPEVFVRFFLSGGTTCETMLPSPPTTGLGSVGLTTKVNMGVPSPSS